jgi:hypothetical protein
MKHLNVTVFGGSQPKVGDPNYLEAYQLGKLLGELKWSVLTGGYIGTMEAVSRGASEAGGHVVGVTCEEIERWRPVHPNQWVAEERRFPTLRERLLALIDHCDAALALPGGVGTMTEIMMTWNQLLTSAIQPKPLIVIGKGWETVLQTFLDNMDGYVPASQRIWINTASNVEQAVAMLQEYAGSGKV